MVYKLTHNWYSNFPRLGNSKELAPLHHVLGVEGQAWLRLWASWAVELPLWASRVELELRISATWKHQFSAAPDLPGVGPKDRVPSPPGALMPLQREDLWSRSYFIHSGAI